MNASELHCGKSAFLYRKISTHGSGYYKLFPVKLISLKDNGEWDVKLGEDFNTFYGDPFYKKGMTTIRKAGEIIGAFPAELRQA